jgi:trehalose 6-phosphate synthase
VTWTKARLESVARNRLGGAKLIVVANREPYSHRSRDGHLECVRPAGGLTTALDPVMRACGGVWVAHGSGEADREASDDRGRVAVPPGDPSYVLHRVWLTNDQFEGYYSGFANSALWPLCHHAYQRPAFDPDQWAVYREVNRLFAAAVLEEARGGPAIVFVQDYHLALLPRLLKDARPDLVVAQFWHVPWPNPETFRVCPWAGPILDGLLGNDYLAFHTQRHCNNFLDTVDRTVECRVDRDRFAVVRHDRLTRVRPHPISIDPDAAAEHLGPGWERRAAAFRRDHQLGGRQLLVGVDRLDYTKGIPERLRAVGRLLDRHPDLKGTFHFLQVAAPSRTTLPAYRELGDEVRAVAARVNAAHGDDRWRPVVLLNEQYGPEEVYLLYRTADGCVVSSLHDGMNLVAKEFVAARGDGQGVLVLSEFAGAACELTDAVIVNPFDPDGLADGLYAALTMPADEQRRRMRRMRRQVGGHNVYRWAGTILTEVAGLVRRDRALPRVSRDPKGSVPTSAIVGASRLTGSTVP